MSPALVGGFLTTTPPEKSRIHMLQLLKPARLEPVLCNKRSHQNEKPVHHKEE